MNNIFEPIKEEMVERIKLLRVMFDRTFTSPDHGKMLMKGGRFMDNDAIFLSFCQNVIERLNKEGMKFDAKVSAETALEEIKKMSQQDKDQRILDVLSDKASTDYYYRYEKSY